MTGILHSGTSRLAEGRRLIGLDRSRILLPDLEEGVSLAHMAQEPELIPRPLHRGVADCRRLGMRGRRLNLNAAKVQRRTLPTLLRSIGRLVMPSLDQMNPTVTEVDCGDPVVGAA
jgi:hypothetical protein